MTLATAFAALAERVATATGAPFWDGQVVDQTAPGAYDDDGNFVPGTPPRRRGCKVQIDSLDERSRPEGWTDKDYRFIILSATLDGTLDTDAEVEVPTGPRAGRWLVSSLNLDAASIGYVGRGVKAV